MLCMCCMCGLLRAVWICAALLMRTEVESERVEFEGAELNTGVGFGWGACGGMSMDARIHLRVNKHTGGALRASQPSLYT